MSVVIIAKRTNHVMKKPKNYLKRSSRVKLSGFYFRKQTGTDFRPEIRGSLSGNPDTEKTEKK